MEWPVGMSHRREGLDTNARRTLTIDFQRNAQLSSVLSSVNITCSPRRHYRPAAGPGEVLGQNTWGPGSSLSLPPVGCLLDGRLPLRSKKGNSYSIAERTVLELIPVLDSQPAGDVSHKPDGRLPILSAKRAVTPATLKRAATNFAAW